MGHQAHEYEFFGPIGTTVLTTVLPLVVLGLVYACNGSGCLQLAPLALPGFPSGQPLYTHEAMLAVCGWFGAILALHLVLPAQAAQGVVLPNRRRLTYRLNGGGHAAVAPPAHVPTHMLAGAQQSASVRALQPAARAAGRPQD
jgi:hypothetical protein